MTASHPLLMDARLELALSPGRAAPVLAAVLGASPDEPCAVLDAKCDSDHGCTVLYQFGGRLVVGTTIDGDGPGGDASGLAAEALGLRVFVFPDDPALPCLTDLLDPAEMAATLSPALDARVLRCRVRLVRYRPGRRCTLRIDAWVSGAGGELQRRTLFGKVYHDAKKAASVWEEMRQLSGTEPVRSGRLRLATATAWLPEVPMVVQEPVAGIGLDGLLGPLAGTATVAEPRGERGVLAAAGAIAALHGGELASARVRPADKEVKRMARRVAENIGGLDPALSERMIAQAEQLKSEFDALPSVLGLVQGDCKPSQFLLERGPVGLLDFDHCGLADPAGDVGNFAASLRQMDAKQVLDAHGSAASAERSRWLARMERSFLDQYERERQGDVGPAFRERVAWYERTALLRKAIRAFARSPRSPLPAAFVDAASRVEEVPSR
jgi:phosphotransferase family enzyme